MQNKLGVMSIGIIGVIVILFTLVAFFLLNIERTALHWWALIFLLISQLALFFGLIFIRTLSANHGMVFIRSGIVTTLFLYFTLTLISAIFVNVLWNNVNSFILVQLGIMVLAAIIIISIYFFFNKIAASDKNIIAASSFMNDCEGRIHSLLVDTKNKDYTQSLNAVYESIKYADKVGSSSVDRKIDEALTKLETAMGDNQEDGVDIKDIFDDITFLLNRRKAEMLQSKRGGF